MSAGHVINTQVAGPDMQAGSNSSAACQGSSCSQSKTAVHGLTGACGTVAGAVCAGDTAAGAVCAGHDPLIALDDVTLRYGDDVTALSHVNLAVASGERICVLGANGSGKSTLASVIAGLLAPDEGTVSLVGRTVCRDGQPDFEAYGHARRKIGLVFQNPDDQIVTSIVEEDVAFGPENLCLPPDEIGRRVERELARVAMGDYARSDPSRLSGGQKQRVAIAGALAMEPEVLVLDEPGALLDVRGRRGIMRVMAGLRAQGTTIIHITHFMEEALAADRVLVMDHGRIMFDGGPPEVFSHCDELLALGLELPFTARLSAELRVHGFDVPWTCDDEELREALAPQCACTRAGHASAAEADGLPQERVPSDQTGRTTTTGGAPQGNPACTVERVSYSYNDDGGRRALEDISFGVSRGSSVAIVGQTGSGKSTLVRLLCALEVPDAGRIVVDGIDTARKRDRRLLHGRIGYVMQHPERQLFAETVLEDVAYGPRNMGLSPDEVRARCARALELVGLTGREEASPFTLSGGQQRLCAIAGVLAMEPKVLVLDEPMAGLDPHGRAQLEQILSDVLAAGTTSIRVTHSMDDAAKANQVIVLAQARLLMRGTPEEVYAPAHEAELHQAGLGLPAATRWALALGLDAAPLTMSALVRELSRTRAVAARLGSGLSDAAEGGDEHGA